MNGTKWDQKISYVRIEGSEQRALKSTFTADGIYYSENYNSPSEQTQSAINAAISAATWHVVPATGTATALNLSYWPEWATREVTTSSGTTVQEEYYGNVWKLGTNPHIPAVATTETAKENTRKTALLQFQYSLGWFERFAARNQFKELLLLRRIAARRAPSGKERSADDVIERLMRFVRIASLQKSVQRLFKFVAHHALSPHNFSIYSFCVVFYHDFLQNTI